METSKNKPFAGGAPRNLPEKPLFVGKQHPFSIEVVKNSLPGTNHYLGGLLIEAGRVVVHVSAKNWSLNRPDTGKVWLQFREAQRFPAATEHDLDDLPVADSGTPTPLGAEFLADGEATFDLRTGALTVHGVAVGGVTVTVKSVDQVEASNG